MPCGCNKTAVQYEVKFVNGTSQVVRSMQEAQAALRASAVPGTVKQVRK